MPVVLLDDLAARVSASPLRELWRSSSPRHVHLVCQPSALHDALLLELLVDALRVDAPGARITLEAPPAFVGLTELLGVSSAREESELRVEVCGDRPSFRAGVLSVPWRYEPHTHAYDRSSFVAALRAAGLSVTTRAPRLSIDPAWRKPARRWLAERVGRFSGPLVIAARTTSVPDPMPLAEGLRRNIGAVVLEEHSLPEALPARAAILELAAAVVTHEGALAHLAAALSVPSLVFVPHGSMRREPSGAHTTCIVEKEPGDFSALDTEKCIPWAEHVAMQSWPHDRLRRLLP
jgi:hypothetical protein